MRHTSALRKLCIAGLAAQFTIFSAAGSFVHAEDITPLRAQALNSYHEGRYDEAITLYKRIVAITPHDPDVLRDLMWVLWKDERFFEAGQVANHVLALHPDDKEAKGIAEKAPLLALRANANAQYHSGHYKEASQMYKQLVDSDPSNASLLRDYMWSLWELGQYTQAREAAARILKVAKNDSEAKDMLERAPMAELRAEAVAHYRAGRYDKAVVAYEKLLEKKPNNPSIMKDLYWAYWQTGNFGKVLAVANKLVDLYPNDPESWNLLGRVQTAQAHQEDALAAYQKSLSLNPNQTDARRMVGRLLVDLRQFDNALDVLGELERKSPEIPTIYPQLAKAQFFKGLYPESARNWSKAVELYPTNENYRIHEARALYYAGQVSLALAKFKKIAAGDGPMKGLATDFIIDDALAIQDYQTAEKVLEEYTAGEVHTQDEPRLLRLATIYLADLKPRKGLATLNRYLKQYPTAIPALLMKADTLYSMGHYGDAVKIFKTVQALNPFSIRAYDGMADAELARGNARRALKAYQPALELDPTDPYQIILKAHYLDSIGQKRQSRELLQRWLKKNQGAPVPVLLYHGLTPFRRDPLLAYPVHLRTEVFADQMRALRAAGYTPLTSDQFVGWIRKNEPLPKKPILITFDDGRLDSFRYADPILQKYNMKATMFIPVANIEGNLPPSYVSWSHILQYQETGRWDFQSHGDMGHTRVPIDAQGRMGLFLVNRQWIEQEKRLETIAEWKKRINTDHENNKIKIAQRLGKTSQSYAFPEGTYGQIDTVNSPQSVPVNMEAIKKHFKVAFHQDRFGLNVRSRDPMYLTRLEPHADWSGADLIHHLENNDPRVLMYRRLLWQAAWDDHPRLAYQFLGKLKESGASQVVLLGEEGRLRTTLGDPKGGSGLMEEALSKGKDPDTEKLYPSVKAMTGPSWTPGYTYSDDRNHRQSSIFQQTIRPFPVSRLNLGVDYEYAVYKGRSVTPLSSNGVGLSLFGRLSLYHTFIARGMWHWFPASTPAKDTYTGSLLVDSNWGDYFKTKIMGGTALYDNILAIRSGITEDYLNASAQVSQDGPWDLVARVQGGRLSDANRRYGLEAEIGRQLVGDFKGIYRYTFDHMDEINPNYYSPQQLHQHQLGLQFAPHGGNIQPSITYLPGVGKERGTPSRMIHDLNVDFQIRLGLATTLRPSYSYMKTPTYWRNTYNIEFTHFF